MFTLGWSCGWWRVARRNLNFGAGLRRLRQCLYNSASTPPKLTLGSLPLGSNMADGDFLNKITTIFSVLCLTLGQSKLYDQMKNYASKIVVEMYGTK